MKHLFTPTGRLLKLLGLVVLVLALVVILNPQEQLFGSGILPPPTPRPPTAQPIRTTSIDAERTSTPQPSMFGTVPAILVPSVTPPPVSQVIDLVPQISENDKAKVYVRRANGTYVVFLTRFETEISQLPLGTGDMVIQKIPPPSLMGHQPPRTSSGLTPTIPAYPAPVK